ncbi:hypothetical protein [Ensifer sp. LCM 4579]|uniref:hypothetical protein n=1 Tax=Ensifer sp. LCM 4579 TaxID=1848292 RepID=UPI0010423C51|nr:hypothetical protein [Ensifer sp. LCM 4579]
MPTEQKDFEEQLIELGRMSLCQCSNPPCSKAHSANRPAAVAGFQISTSQYPSLMGQEDIGNFVMQRNLADLAGC